MGGLLFLKGNRSRGSGGKATGGLGRVMGRKIVVGGQGGSGGGCGRKTDHNIVCKKLFINKNETSKLTSTVAVSLHSSNSV